MAPKSKGRFVGLGEVIATLESGSATERSGALDDLLYLFSKNSRVPELDTINDKEYHRLYDGLFRHSVSATQACLAAKTAGALSKGRSGITKCGQALREITEHAAFKLKRKTMIAVVDHITQTVPGRDDRDDDSLLPSFEDYLKALSALLTNPASVEILATNGAESWFTCVDFTVQTIDRYLDGNERESVSRRGSPAPGTAQASSLGISTLRSTASSTKSHSGSRIKKEGLLDPLLKCLWHLLSAPNAPVLKRSKAIASAPLQILQRKESRGRNSVVGDSFKILSGVLALVQTDDTEQAMTLTRELIPLASHWWQVSSRNASRDDALTHSNQAEILKTLFSMHLQLESLVRRDPGSVPELEDLCDLLWVEYSRQDSRAKLQQDDLTYSTVPQHEYSFKTHLFRLRPYNADAERRWALVHIHAILEGILFRESQSLHAANEDSPEHPRKKRRTTAGSSRLRQKLNSHDVTIQFTALQIVPFFVTCVKIPIADMTEILSMLTTLTGHKNIDVSIWAMIAAASLAQTSFATGHSLALTWKQLWSVAARNLSLPAHCRASCLLLDSIMANDLVSYHEISDDLNRIVTTADVSGPAVVVDSSIIFMTRLLQLRNYKLPSASYASSSHVVRWLFLRWDPADTTFISFYSAHVAPLDVVNLLRLTYGDSTMTLTGLPRAIAGPVGETWALMQDRANIVRYLLLLNDTDPTTTGSTREKPSIDTAVQLAETSNSMATKKLVAELLLPKLEEGEAMCDSWSKWSEREEGSSQISTEKLHSLLSCLVVVAFIIPQLAEVKSRQSQDLEPTVFRLLKQTFKVASQTSANQTLYETVLESIRPYIPSCSTSELSSIRKEFPQLFVLFSELSDIFREKAHKESSGPHDDPMDLDDGFEPQESHSSSASKAVMICRRSTLMLDSMSFYPDTIENLHLLKVFSQDPGQIGLIPSSFLDSFLACTDENILLCRSLCKELFVRDLVVDPDDAVRVVQKFGEIIGTSLYSSCEVALATCLNVIEAFMALWTDERSSLSPVVSDMYEYYIKTALRKNLLSSNVQMALASLLFALTQVAERFPQGLRLPTTVVSLLDILKQGSIPVKFFVGEQLPTIFGRYVLKTHEKVFLSILDVLPTDGNVPEEIALRLFVLSELAQRWPTLLRRGVYHIFETPGNLQDATKHAKYCLEKVASALGLDHAQKLFDLFAPQLLYTWLDDDEAEKIGSIPFEIFGFSNLEDLLKRARSEAAAILIMRGQDTNLTELARLLGLTPPQLVQGCFSKIMAYSIAHDISISRSDEQPSGEVRVRKMMGKENFLEEVNSHFTDIIAIFFTLIDQEDPVEKSWAKDAKFVRASEIMTEIKQTGQSNVELVANQQPSFKAKYLTREMILLCSRTQYEIHNIWTPALVVAVARKLFNMIHLALGPLHACSVIRKIRVMICLAGPHALESYPLEMLLYSLHPYLVDSECADDALGMSQYLLTHGSEALSQSPSFLAGYALTTLCLLKVFLESSQASTTQESQFKATMSKAQKFHMWFAKYLDKYQSPLLRDDSEATAFKAIVQSAAHVRSSGNAERDTYESNLLLEILRDEESNQPLLNEVSRNLALEILCKDFKFPVSFLNDAVSSDEEALKMATAVWKSSRAQASNDQYLVWVGRVVGRGFAASGHVDPTLLRESKLSEYRKFGSSDISSEQGLLGLLQALTVDSDCFTASLAESALRSIVTEAVVQENNDLLVACQNVLTNQLLDASNWDNYRTPPSDNPSTEPISERLAFSTEALEDPRWPRYLTTILVGSVSDSIILSALSQTLAHVKGFAEAAFPFVIHLVLLSEREKDQSARRALSASLKDWLKFTSPTVKENLSLVINALVYLRTQKLPKESSIADRRQWLDLDLSVAASAAARCGMHKTALLFVESVAPEASRTSRRSSAVRAQESTDVLLDIFENIDDPDAYYGLPNNSSLTNVLARLEYEKDGSKSLAFRGAQLDSHIRSGDPEAVQDGHSLVETLSNLGLSGLSHSLLQTQQGIDGRNSVENTFSNARRLGIWNLPAPPSTENPSVSLYKAYQACHQAIEPETARRAIHDSLGRMMQNVVKGDLNTASIRRHLGALAALSELDDMLNVSHSSELDSVLTKFEARSKWMNSGRYADVSHILSCRETTLGLLGQNLQVRVASNVNQPDNRLLEVKSMLLSSAIYRFHQAAQESLNIATALNDLIEPSLDLGLTIDAAAKMEAANSLWDHGEMSSSIRMLQSIDEESDLKRQTVAVRRSDLLAKIGYQVSVARLEKPDNIQKNYLQPALKELKGQTGGREASKVYRQFAMFCDEQLQNPDSLEDLARLQHLKEGKSNEVQQLKTMVSNASSTQLRRRYENHLGKAKQWLGLDEQELRRVEQSRSEFVRLSLENYLLSLSASDEYNNDALRFAALWLERSGEDFTNEAVRKYIDKVPTRKFAPLMNQLTSRLLDQSNPFQKLLIELVYRICVDHPYHGMYQIWSGVKSRMNKEDDAAVLRQKATERVAKRLAQNEAVQDVWVAIDKTSRLYHALATDPNGRYKAGQKLAMKDVPPAVQLINGIAKYSIPPPTMQMELSSNKDYSQVPKVVKIEPQMTIASGVSAPKIITLVGSNGERFKQLVKGGSDDLRQDAIMEQVFSAVSSVLKHHRSTQQRQLGIRTYKVLPLTSSSGLIEFVPNTIPLHEYLMPAHERYHPKDLKGSSCRKDISQAQDRSVETRVAVYKKVTGQFQPVMRYFFMEYFMDPDEWYAKRTAYTRSTAAISILGHVLGLGDRHGHNILLDSVTGEVVHIDLGVAFEMGRVLPVPELVPFRLTRDIVDGMGVTKTEGVFRRCCEFTLDALREETYSIMTILDVLRYDPLYSWSISPVRIAKLQDTRRDEDGGYDGTGASELEFKKKKGNGNGSGGVMNEPSEADRALEVVKKKLSKTLSVTATVNDLINQAMDVQNLAVLYSGWAAYA